MNDCMHGNFRTKQIIRAIWATSRRQTAQRGKQRRHASIVKRVAHAVLEAVGTSTEHGVVRTE